MNNKDLFDAIHNVDENYITSAWDNTEADRPIVIRPEQRSAKSTARNIMLGAGGTAVAAALGFAVITGANGTLSNPFSGANNPDESTISYIKDKFDDRKDGSDFDPNSPIPVDFIAPDGSRLTYNDLVGGIFCHEYDFWVDDVTTAEDIAQMTDLFENFYEYIQPDEHGCNGGFVLKGFTYLPNPETGKIKRYNQGDKYCGFTLGTATVRFDENGNYEFGGGFSERTEVFAEITLGEESTVNGGYYEFTSTDPVLSALSGDPNSDESHGVVGLFTEFPLNTPIKVGFDVTGIYYNPNKTPSLSIDGYAHSFEPFNDSLKQWLEKDLVLPNAALSDDFDFLKYGGFDSKTGDEIRAVDDGEIVDTISNSGVTIKHGENLYTTYHGFDVSVNKGDMVKAGDVIGIADYDGEIFYKFTQEKPNNKYYNDFGMDPN